MNKNKINLAGTKYESSDLEMLEDLGLAHWHYRLVGKKKLLRVPKQSQMNLTPAKNLQYEGCCYQLCHPSGVTPIIFDIIKPTKNLPLGALVIEEIIGREIILKRDFLKIAKSLAALHSLSKPSKNTILFTPQNPIKAMLDEVTEQASFLSQSAVGKKVEKIVLTQLDFVKNNFKRLKIEKYPISLISFDCHPSNFIIDSLKRAILVDLEKCRFSYAAFDLAHASNYTSTTWGKSAEELNKNILDETEIIEFYKTWLQNVPIEFAKKSLPFFVDLKILMWLWSTSWSAKWLVQSEQNEQTKGQNWDKNLTQQKVIDKVMANVLDYLNEETITQITKKWSPNSSLRQDLKNLL